MLSRGELIVTYVGFALLLWPFATRGAASAFIGAGSSLFTGATLQATFS